MRLPTLQVNQGDHDVLNPEVKEAVEKSLGAGVDKMMLYHEETSDDYAMLPLSPERCSSLANVIRFATEAG